MWEYLIKHGLVPEKIECPTCKTELQSSDRKYFRCQKSNNDGQKKCSFKQSVLKDTLFKGSHLPIGKTLQFVYHWLTRNTPRHEFLEEDLEIDSHTVVDWSSFCREVLVQWILETSEDQNIGGEGVTVELDEAIFRKQKYKRARPIKGKWIFGALERENPTRCFYVAAPNRTKKTLLKIIKETNSSAATTIMSDCWRANKCLQDEGFIIKPSSLYSSNSK